MVKPTKDTLFKPSLSRMEAKNQVTDKSARGIIELERVQNIAKTERLREARLALETPKPSPKTS